MGEVWHYYKTASSSEKTSWSVTCSVVVLTSSRSNRNELLWRSADHSHNNVMILLNFGQTSCDCWHCRQAQYACKKFCMYTKCVKCMYFVQSYCTSAVPIMPWCNYISESVRKLCVAYDNVFRLLCDEPRDCSASFMFVRQGLPSCKIIIRQIYII